MKKVSKSINLLEKKHSTPTISLNWQNKQDDFIQHTSSDGSFTELSTFEQGGNKQPTKPK